jgi:hypothetical protein
LILLGIDAALKAYIGYDLRYGTGTHKFVIETTVFYAKLLHSFISNGAYLSLSECICQPNNNKCQSGQILGVIPCVRAFSNKNVFMDMLQYSFDPRLASVLRVEVLLQFIFFFIILLKFAQFVLFRQPRKLLQFFFLCALLVYYLATAAAYFGYVGYEGLMFSQRVSSKFSSK